MILVPIVLLIAEELKITPAPFYYNYGYCCQYGWRNNDDCGPAKILIASATKYTFIDVSHLTSAIVIIVIGSLGLIWLLYRGKCMLAASGCQNNGI